MKKIIVAMFVALALTLTLAAPPAQAAGGRVSPTVAKKKFNEGDYGRIKAGTMDEYLFKHPKKAKKVLVQKVTKIYAAQSVRGLAPPSVRARAAVRKWANGSNCVFAGRDYYIPQPCLEKPLAPLTDAEAKKIKIFLCAGTLTVVFIVALVRQSDPVNASTAAGGGSLGCFWGNAATDGKGPYAKYRKGY